MSEDLERALRARREFEDERDRRMEERFKAQDRSVTDSFRSQDRSVTERLKSQADSNNLQLSEMRRRLDVIEAAHDKLVVLAFGAPVVTAVIVYLLTRSGG